MKVYWKSITGLLGAYTAIILSIKFLFMPNIAITINKFILLYSVSFTYLHADIIC
ncbi:19562_t:CDS:2 [Dentiscutata erythropus]|uniref:19562_t:CDS:1 n=1 Tax=Dentiscutata erythropus TaxID=1348616 RepID=A0A9N9G5W8_9GLOM|nr:19562_t:CDS:2 [Dentiscutata erythropus]